MSAHAKNIFKYIGGLVLVSAVYYLTAIIGLKFDAVSGFATLVWPPTGIAVATLFVLGLRYWPAVALGAFAANFASGASWPVALGIAGGNTSEALLAVLIMRRLDVRAGLERVRDTLAFIGLAVPAGTLASSLIGVTSLWLGGIVTAGAYVETWIAWWIGDVLGALVVGSLLIVAGEQFRIKRRPVRPEEPAALLAILVVLGLLSFITPFGLWEGNPPVIYLVFVPLLWAALRFGQVGAVLAVFVTSVIAVWGTIGGGGPFVRGDLSESLFYLQLFMGAVAVTTMLVAATDRERRRAQDEARELNKGLESKVEHRTGQLKRANEELGRAKEDLIRRMAILQAVLNSIGEGVAAVDATGMPIIVNPAALRILGTPSIDYASPLERMARQFPAYYLDGKTVVPLDELPITRALGGEILDDQRLMLKPAEHPHGLLISVSAAPIRADGGGVMGAVVIFREITS